LSYAEDAIKHGWRLAIAEQHRVTSRQMWSDDRDFDDVIAAHRSRDTTVERRSQLLHRRPTGNSMAAKPEAVWRPARSPAATRGRAWRI